MIDTGCCECDSVDLTTNLHTTGVAAGIHSGNTTGDEGSRRLSAVGSGYPFAHNGCNVPGIELIAADTGLDFVQKLDKL